MHKLSIVAATLPPMGGRPEVQQIETTRVAIRRFIERLGGPEGLAVCYEAGPGGFDLLRVLTELGVDSDDAGKDLFVHHSNVAGSGFKSLAEGAKVSYDTEQGPKGPAATRVELI